MKKKIRELKNWDNKTWLSSSAYIDSFNTFLLKKKKINKNSLFIIFFRNKKLEYTRQLGYTNNNNQRVEPKTYKDAWDLFDPPLKPYYDKTKKRLLSNFESNFNNNLNNEYKKHFSFYK